MIFWHIKIMAKISMQDKLSRQNLLYKIDPLVREISLQKEEDSTLGAVVMSTLC